MHLFSLFALFLALPLWANTTVESRIHDVDYGIQPHEDTLVLLENGRVLRIKDKEKSYLLLKDSQLKFSFDQNNYLLNVTENKIVTQEEPLPSEAPLYEPTVIEGLETAVQYFKTMKGAKSKSECFNRAHVWSYELWMKHQVKSQKIFIFFSKKYIRDNDFEWWFHVAPMVVVNENSVLVERVLDRTFSKGPREISEWKTIFIGKDIQCATVSQYSDYADYPYTNECSFMKAPMYVHQPVDMEMQEVWNIQKSDFSITDLITAYKNALDANFNGGF